METMFSRLIIRYKDLEDTTFMWRGVYNTLTDRKEDYPYGGTYARAHFRSIRSDIEFEAASYRRLQESDYTAEEVEALHNGPIEGLSHHCRGIWGQRLFVTKGGLIGRGPGETRAGDMIYLLHEGRLPFILRPIKSGEKRGCFEYVWHAYVHGVMDGEALRGSFAGEWVTLA
ncbi:hypothetical protein B0H63DRAFT_477448 [Podospora didyma]|uniref:Uncharacterized protein n=1 Tax=Podospora didyma TaxID=330526 RepID=A0AAE0KJS2_9PEZI|nr:hypothetical protein B0H63DRAFT_477448 [Podospora didyma]